VPADLPLEDEGLTVADPAPFSAARGRNRWEWIRPMLLATSVLVPFLCAVIAAMDPWNTGPARVFAFVLAAAFAGWTLALDRKRCAAGPDGGLLWALVYLLGATALFVGMALIDPIFLFLAFPIYWQIFATLELAPAIAAAVVFSAVVLLLQLQYTDRSLTEDPTFLIGGAISLGFAIFMAVWIGGIIEQSGQRAGLIAELDATRAELADANHRAGVELERERLRQEIHDTLAQGFTSIVMLAQASESALDGGATAQALQHVRAIETTARENLVEARNLVEGTGPAPLTDSTLPDALRRLTERLGTDAGIVATTEIHDSVADRPPATEVAVLRAAQEALSNVRRHADASRVNLSFRSSDEGIVLEVTDDGTGFDVARSTDDPRHVGLRGMRARLEEVGGDVLVDSAPGRGTTVIVTLP
jgi:signal transduction histidine kinase